MDTIDILCQQVDYITVIILLGLIVKMLNDNSGLIVAIATVVLAYLALFGDSLKDKYITYPRLDIMKIDCNPHMMEHIDAKYIKAYYYRFRAKNSGNKFAEGVEIYAKELLKDGDRNIYEAFIPRRFKWTHISIPTYDFISPFMEKHCELLIIQDSREPQSRNWLELEGVREYIDDTGTYYLAIQIMSKNHKKPVEKIVKIRINCWNDNVDKMKQDNVVKTSDEDSNIRKEYEKLKLEHTKAYTTTSTKIGDSDFKT